MEKKIDPVISKDDDSDLNNDDYDVEIESASDDEDEDKSNKNGKTILKENKEKKLDKLKEVVDSDAEQSDISDTEDGVNLIGNIANEHIDDDPDQYKLDTMAPDELVREMIAPPTMYRNKMYKGPLDPIKHRLLQYQVGIDEYIVPLELSKTSHILQKAERTELIGIRAQHIAMGAEPYVDIINETDPIQIATKELKKKRFPLKLKRSINSRKTEIKDPNHMTIIWDN